MRIVTVWRNGYDFATQTRTCAQVDRFIVGPSGIITTLTGEAPRDVRVLDPATGQRVTLQSDPERWADLLPGAYRSGDLVVSVNDVPDGVDPVLLSRLRDEAETWVPWPPTTQVDAWLGTAQRALAGRTPLEILRDEGDAGLTRVLSVFPQIAPMTPVGEDEIAGINGFADVFRRELDRWRRPGTPSGDDVNAGDTDDSADETGQR